MLIRPQQKHKNLIFYNNLVFIVIIFSIVCLLTSCFLGNQRVKTIHVTPRENILLGPIVVKDKSLIYRVDAFWTGDHSSTYLTGEVIDDDDNTLYEFGKDFWHETGFDEGEYYDESDRRLSAYLTFNEKGKYYIQFNTEEKMMNLINIKLSLMKSSYVVHSMVGSYALILALLIFYFLNRKWVNEKLERLNEILEEACDD